MQRSRLTAHLHLVAFAAIIGAACLWPPASAADRGKRSQSSDADLQPDAKIPLDVQAWGLPDGGQLGLPCKFGVACYDGRLRFNRYTLELLTAKNLSGDAQRRDCFKADARWPKEFRATLADYQTVSKVYDRGHEACSADQTLNQEAQDETFLLSNMTPQHAQLNRGLWKNLEEFLRKTARREDVRGVWVVTVPIFAPGDAASDVAAQGTEAEEFVQYSVAGPNHVPIPTHFGKVALILGKRVDNPVILMAWLFPNRRPLDNETLDSSRVTVDLVEHWSGLDFFASLPAGLQERLESAK